MDKLLDGFYSESDDEEHVTASEQDKEPFSGKEYCVDSTSSEAFDILMREMGDEAGEALDTDVRHNAPRMEPADDTQVRRSDVLYHLRYTADSGLVPGSMYDSSAPHHFHTRVGPEFQIDIPPLQQKTSQDSP